MRVILRRRVEVTVERETISAIVPGHRPRSVAQTAVRAGDFGIGRMELPEPHVPDEAPDSGPTEPSEKVPSE